MAEMAASCKWHHIDISLHIRATEKCRGKNTYCIFFTKDILFSKTLIFIADIPALIFQRRKENIYL